MRRHNFILVFVIAIFIGLSMQPAFAQKTTKWGKKGKFIEFPLKQLFVEVTVSGSGNHKCHIPIATCTWKINRKYSATIPLNNYLKKPFEEMMSEPGTASAIANAKVTVKAKANNAAFNTEWITTAKDPIGGVNVEVEINDETKQTWKQKIKGDNYEEKSITNTWTAKTKGKGFIGTVVILDRQLGAFRVFASLNSDAEMIKEFAASGEDYLPIRLPVFDVPEIEGKLRSEVIIPFGGDIPSEETATFEKNFSNLKAEYFNLGLGILETRVATITVTYRFGNKTEAKKQK